MTKPTAELIAFLRSWGKHDSLGEKEYVVVPLKQVNQAADRLAEQEVEIERLKKALTTMINVLGSGDLSLINNLVNTIRENIGKPTTEAE